MKKIYSIFSGLTLCACLILFPYKSFSQDIDSTQIGKEYPYSLPILGKKAYKKGYKLQLPYGLSVGTIFNKQGLILEDFEMAIAAPGTPNSELEYIGLDGILDFGPSEGRINTLNIRGDAWLLPFLQVGGYYGRVWGEQTISFSVVGSDLFYSTTDIKGQYYGFNVLGIVPLGFVNAMADYSWSWTTNERLDEPVLVKVSGMRLVRRIMTKTPDRFFAVWAGAQFQNLTSRTSGNIPLDEALSISDEDKQRVDDHIDGVRNDEIPIYTREIDNPIPGGDPIVIEVNYSDLPQGAQDGVDRIFDGFRGLLDDDVYYQFDKRLEYEWNMLLGFNYQHNPRWQFRTEYGFLKSKQQLMFMLNYRFGL